MNAPFGYPSTFDGSSQWTMVAPQQYFGAQYDRLYHHQASLLQAQQQQQQAAAAAYASHAAYAPAPYAHAPAHQYYAGAQQQHYAAAPAVAEPARSRFAFAQSSNNQFQQQRFNLPPPAHHAVQHVDEYMSTGWEESASRATLESEHMSFLLGRLAQSADSSLPSSSSSDEYDHPSHIRPPHRAEVPAVSMIQEEQQQPITYDLIPNVSSVPPPPPIERSAVPLADVATEMIWEACRQGYLQTVEAAAVLSPVNPVGIIGQPARNGPRRSGGGEQFGVIGSGRTRKASSDGYETASSSPSSSLPGTPSGLESLEDVEARRQRLANLGLGSFVAPSSRSRTRSAVSPFPVEPSPAFRAFVKQILTATLVAPEDLVYALCLVSQIPLDKVIPPTPAEPGQDAQTTSMKAAPFKIFLGSLMVANKMLQDNANDTFSTVSGIPLPDVNALEAHVLLSLKFDVNVPEDKWVSFLAVVVNRVRSGLGQLGDLFAVQDVLERLIRAAARNTATPLPLSPVLVPTPLVPAAVECPSTPLNPSAASYLDLDASGPLESPMRFVPARHHHHSSQQQRPIRRSTTTQAIMSQDSPLVNRSRPGCRGGASNSLLPPNLGAAIRSRSFGQEIPRNAIC
ncbi:hypothetical protein JCM8547_002748 [Rhodosporidiobolus lusitaniae]